MHHRTEVPDRPEAGDLFTRWSTNLQNVQIEQGTVSKHSALKTDLTKQLQHTQKY